MSRHGDVGEISFFRPPTLGYESSICEGHIEVPNWEPKSEKLPMVQLTSALDIPRGSKNQPLGRAFCRPMGSQFVQMRFSGSRVCGLISLALPSDLGGKNAVPVV